MPRANDSSGPDPAGSGLPKSLPGAVGSQSQLDFDIAFYEHVLEREPDYVDVLRCQGELLARKGLHGPALAIDRRLAGLLPGDCVVRYNLACSLALGGFRREALAALRAALEHGYDDFEHLEADSDLDSLRHEPAYRALVWQFVTHR